MTENFKELLKQTTKIQTQMKQAQNEMHKQRVTGVAGAGQVKVVLTGRYDAIDVQIDPSLMEGDREVIEDLIAGAINDAVKRVEQMNEEHITNIASELPFNPRDFPF
ncbi:MAG: YbaB/EbfC family nucleoid-associated protein [Acidiferrobacterales bacterium]|nr:YbaB/EbfC family nucleoid-associated protein [Acidiferrobacterales bacterium]